MVSVGGQTARGIITVSDDNDDQSRAEQSQTPGLALSIVLLPGSQGRSLTTLQ